MKLVYILEDNLYDLKSNLDQILVKFCEPTNDWLNNYFGDSPFRESKFTVEAFELDMSQEKPFLTDFENVRRVYGRLIDLPPSIANSERLWAGLSLGPFWNYTQYRWNIINDCKKNNVLTHFFYGFTTRRAVIRNALARLWWIGKFTYDKTAKDPFEITEFVCEHPDIIAHTLERTAISNNKNVLIPFLRAIMDARSENYLINTNVVAELSKNLNLLGGVYILDALDSDIIYNKTWDLIRKNTVKTDG